MRKGRQADQDGVGAVDRCGKIARHQLRPGEALAQHALIGDAALRLKGRQRLLRAAPEAHLVAGGNKLRDRGSAAGAASDHGDFAHSDPARSVITMLACCDHKGYHELKAPACVSMAHSLLSPSGSKLDHRLSPEQTVAHNNWKQEMADQQAVIPSPSDDCWQAPEPRIPGFAGVCSLGLASAFLLAPARRPARSRSRVSTRARRSTSSSAIRPPVRPTSTRGSWPATWESTFPAIRTSSRAICPAPAA